MTCSRGLNMRDLVGGLFWLGISIFVLIEAVKTGVGTLHTPNPGFFPFWSAVVLGLFALILMVVNFFSRQRKSGFAELWKDTQWRKGVYVVCSLFLYLLVLPILGYLISTFALMLFIMAAIERWNLWWMGASAATMVVASYLLFDVFLEVNLPRGILGF
jgi:putative tricarboxylic transport membrane protein